MNHLPALPILLPLAAAVLCLLASARGITVQRVVSLLALLGLAVVATLLLILAQDGEIRVYRLGDWPAPYGIVLVLDRLSAMMLALTAALALPVLLRAIAGSDGDGRHFHALFQLQIAGLNGAFLTGDLFNLFVFFEILLLASYALLMHGGGRARARAGLAYVIINLTGSAAFLFAMGLVYGTLGTLTLADVAVVLPTVAAADQALVRVALLLLAGVFVLKAAMVPLGFWLPHTYGAASAPVAALFAIMTKVGIYALLRVSTIGFAAAPFSADLLLPWLPLLGLATMLVGVIGALAARQLSGIVANVLLISSGTLLVAVAAADSNATAAALYYLPQGTLVAGGLFLLCDFLARQRGAFGDRLERGPRLPAAALSAGCFLLLAMAASGVPPLSGFLGKIMLMQSLQGNGLGPLFWGMLLFAGLALSLVFARAASTLLWEPGIEPAAPAQQPRAAPAWQATAVPMLLCVAGSLAFVLAAAPLTRYTQATAAQLHARDGYITAVLGVAAEIKRERRP